MSGPDALAALTGAAAQELLGGLLASTDEQVTSWRVRQVDHRPGTSTTVAYDVTLRGPAGEHRQVVVASTAASTAATTAPGVAWVRTGHGAVGLWRFPLDPELPALAAAVDEEAVRALLTSYGVPRGPLRLDVRTYRPRRRAVVEVQAPGRRVFLKVVRPAVVAALAERHRLLTGAGLPVPRCLGWTERGLLVLDGLSGTPLRTRLREGGSPAPDAAALVALLDRLPEQVSALPRRRSWSDLVDHYAGVTAAALPSEAERCRGLARAVTTASDGSPPDAPSHGDFYETQLLLDGARPSGLLDVDTVGPGRRADDLACLLAHVTVLAQLEPTHRDSSLALADRWLTDVTRVLDPVDLRARAAGVVVSLATGPHRVQQRGWQDHTRARLDLAEQWLAARATRPVRRGG